MKKDRDQSGHRVTRATKRSRIVRDKRDARCDSSSAAQGVAGPVQPASTAKLLARGALTKSEEIGVPSDDLSDRALSVGPDESVVSPDARDQAMSIIQLGCDRETAAHFLGLSLEELNRAAESDAEFGRALARAEAAAELAHMRCVQLAAQDPKNWRTSVWWLERMRPNAYKARKPPASRNADLALDTKTNVEPAANEVTDKGTRKRLFK